MSPEELREELDRILDEGSTADILEEAHDLLQGALRKDS